MIVNFRLSISMDIFENLKQDKPIVCYDVETSGLSPVHDHIIQLSATKVEFLPSLSRTSRNWYVRLPQGAHIAESAVAVHNITEEFLEENGEDPVKVAREFKQFIKGCDLLTYNGNRFDIQFIDNFFKLIGYDIMSEDRRHYDAYQMDCRLNPRDLTHTYRRYTGKEFEGAHDARYDVLATLEIFAHMVKDNPLHEIAEWEENNLLVADGSIRNVSKAGEEPVLVFARGKYKDCDFLEICKKDVKYIQWFKDKVASPSTWRMLTQYYNKHREHIQQ